jgi:hypothetical protein
LGFIELDGLRTFTIVKFNGGLSADSMVIVGGVEPFVDFFERF